NTSGRNLLAVTFSANKDYKSGRHLRHRKINEGILLTIKSGFEYQRFIIVKFINFSMVIIFGIKMTPTIVFNQCIAAKKRFFIMKMPNVMKRQTTRQ
ncbi:hypothetical protein, partial [Klebsiella pneumoniae]|uniref:hypothetical protein n=1 Tax=Klebsiella pneumoniae TaxID=573 RepID=UPI001D0F0FE0